MYEKIKSTKDINEQWRQLETWISNRKQSISSQISCQERYFNNYSPANSTAGELKMLNEFQDKINDIRGGIKL